MREQASHELKSSLQVLDITFAELIAEFKQIDKSLLVVPEKSTHLGNDKDGQRLVDQLRGYFDHPSPSNAIELSLVILVIAIVEATQVGDDFASCQGLQFHNFFRVNSS